ncbi:MAG: efflux RND transporter periplasmic adaptor subunit [Arachidicoccus sp.]|nr:efflux RND transporter periplasmic adaptor subunit [Arachidicoccus sp.]
MKRIHKIYFPVVIAIVSGMVLQSCGNSKSEEKEAGSSDSSSSAPVSVNAFLLNEGNLSTTLTIPGELIAFQNVDLYAKVSSFIKKLYVDVGSQVSRGQLLAVMEAPEINAQEDAANSQVQSLKALYLSDKATYDRLFETSKTPGTVSPNELEIADAKQKSDYAQYQAAISNVHQIQANRNYLEIRAPFDGIITARNVSSGAYVGPATTAIFNLQEQRKLRLVIDVPSTNSGNLTMNSTVNFTVKSLPGQTFKAKVSRLAGALDNKLRSQHIEADVENDSKILLPGMVTEVSMPLNNTRKSFVIPSSALLNSTLGVYVIKASNNKSLWSPVSTGARNADSVEVYGDLKKGDTIITSVTEEIRDSAAINGKLNIQ